MIQKNRLIFIQGIQFILFFITLFYFLPSNYSPYFVGQYFILMFAFMILSYSKGSVLLVGYIFIIAIISLLLGFVKNWSFSMQLQVIFYNIVLISNVSILYASNYFSHKLKDENVTLSKKINELEPYVGYSKILTKNKFEEQSKIIVNGMKRRNEKGYLIYFSLDKFSSYIRDSLFDNLTDIALRIFRSEYDLVGKYSDNSFIVLLQNTDEIGMNIALNRYLSAVKDKIDLTIDELNIKTEVINF